MKGADVNQLVLKGEKSDEEIRPVVRRQQHTKDCRRTGRLERRRRGFLPYNDPDKKEWFIGECANVGIDPKTSTLFDFLETDDKLVAALWSPLELKAGRLLGGRPFL